MTHVQAVRNITGSPAEGADFFDRPRDLARLQRELANGANILLTAPRRIGKTSLILRLCELRRHQGRPAVFLNIEGCADELAFAETLVDGLLRAHLHPEILNRVARAFQQLRRAVGGIKLRTGIDIEMGEVDDPNANTLGRALESIFRRIEADGPEVLIALDEMPELLLALSEQEHGAERVRRLLHWLRGIRQTYRRHIRWVFLGSIGLDTFVDDRHLRKTINDLEPAGLDAPTPEEADRFLAILGQDNGLPLTPLVRQHIIQRIGWPLLNHLQLIFHALKDGGATAADPAAVDQAFQFLLRAENLGQFDSWRQRLNEQFPSPDSAACQAILRFLCQHPQGRPRNHLLNVLMSGRPQADPTSVSEQLARLLLALQRDGYLIENHGVYAFRSFLLREFWHRREIR